MATHVTVSMDTLESTAKQVGNKIQHSTNSTDSKNCVYMWTYSAPCSFMSYNISKLSYYKNGSLADV